MSALRKLACLAASVALGCSAPGEGAGSQSPAAPERQTASGEPEVAVFAEGLVHPWAIEVLPDGRLIVTERPGRLRYVGRDGELSAPIAGVPEVRAQGQGGLLDVALDPRFEQNRIVYLSYSEPGPGGTAGTAVARGRLEGERLSEVTVIFRQQPKLRGPNHFGSRLVFAPDGNLFVTLGERFQFDTAQDLSNTMGKVVRIAPDGSVPQGNPFAGRAGAVPEIWSYGHRNIEAAAINPKTGALWVAEFGPRGGDELNVVQAGRNYGWPEVSWGKHYDGRDIPDPPTRPEFAPSIRQWTPVISPSGMIFYRSARFPGWQGDALIGGLSSQALVVLDVEGDEVVEERRIAIGHRVRDVAEGRDGLLYLATDESDGKILKLTPGPE